ncbi:hypothetical protein DEDE109153_03280 [Deinococcus deserti]|uniref:Uncharacterized protein n=1 Tax=Deinococcus deserti (strain DSM 17065 / CIP 109153 / LMG 22923 / VCD115) TaxID=546414 RepID=C1D1V0_DEIDV|nr:hypothetical protein [Deinococcus deserti]ACO45824.1 conserved hypothetical protein, precursor [Deinococcus deserti VCD115]
MSLVRTSVRAVALLLTTGLLTHAAAQTAPTSPAPATPARPAVTTPAPAGAAAATERPSAATARVASSVAVELSALVKGQIIRCPDVLKLSPQAVCLYTKSSVPALRPLVKTKLGSRAVGDWKSGSKSSSLFVADKAGGNVAAFVLLSQLAATETLLIVDGVQAPAASAARVAAPAGVVKGQPYVLGSDLVGVVNVSNLGGGKFRLSVSGQSPLTVTVGQKTVQREGGAVELPLAPATDGKNLIFPLAGLRALGCTVTPAGNNLTVACGAESVGLRPIVF